MSKNKELDEILASINDDKSRLEKLINPDPVDLPKKVAEPVDEPIAPPAPPIKEQGITPTPVAEKPKKEKKAKKSNDKKADNKILSGTKAYFKKLFGKEISKKAKKIIITVVVIAVAVSGISIGIYEANYGYVRPYEKKYNIVYPKGIQKEFCDDYGKDITIRGSIYVPDTDSKQYVVKSKDNNHSYLERGSTIDADQQFRAIHVDKSVIDLESIYATTDGYLNASQQIYFNTLYDNESYKVIACYYTNKVADSKDKYVFPYAVYGNMTMRSFAEYQDKIESRRLYNTGYNFNYFDSFLTVSVDSDFMPDYVFVVLCKKVDGKVEKGEIAKENKKIHYPQSYYNAKKEHNPYQFASEWYPEIYLDDEECRLTPQSFENM